MLSNFAAEYDPTTGVVLHLSQMLDLPAPSPTVGTDPSLWVAGPLLRVLAAVAAEPEASRRALTSELRAILAPLDGPVVRAEYELSGWYNIAPWVDALTVDQLRILLLDDTYAHDELCRDLLTTWSHPGGVLEDEANRIDHDLDFRLLVELGDVVRRLAATRPQMLREVYTEAALAEVLSAGQDWLREAAELAADLLTSC